MNIIIVDDEINILLGLEKLIDWKSIGYNMPVLFTHPVEALEYIRINGCDVLITDIRMSEMSGLELMEKAHEINTKISIIVLSSYSDYEYMKKALLEKAENYLLKPVKETELITTLIQIKNQSVPLERNTTLIESSTKLANALQEFSESNIKLLFVDLCELNKEKYRQDILEMDSQLRNICTFTPHRHLIIDVYKSILYQLKSKICKRLMIDETAIRLDSIPSSIGSMAELSEFMIKIIQQMLEDAKRICSSDSGTIVDSIEMYIQLNYSDQLTLGLVAKRFFFNPSYLSFVFSKSGDNFISYLNRYRLVHGAALLTETDSTISFIAESIGYSNEKQFYKAFKKAYGCTPTEYRQNHSMIQ